MPPDAGIDREWPSQYTRTIFLHDTGSDASFSTTATASNLPGTGRVIGLAYDAVGKVVEKRLNRLVYKFRSRRNEGVIPIASGPSESTLSVSSVSTNATADNLPGAGRTIGLAYNFFGKLVELRLNRLAEKFQRGPDATARRIKKTEDSVRDVVREHDDDLVFSAKDRKEFKRLCKRLLKYTKSDVLSTKLQALSSVTDVALYAPHLHALLSELDAISTISMVHLDLDAFRDLDPQIRTASERALVTVSEVHAISLNLTLREICYSYEWKGQLELARTNVSGLFGYSRDPAMSFLAFRLFASVQNTISTIFNVVDDGFLITAILNAIHSHISLARDANDGRLDYGSVNWADLDVVVQQGLGHWGPRTTLAASFPGVIKLLRFAFKFSVFLPKTIEFLISVFDEWWSEAHVHNRFLDTPMYLWAAIEEGFKTLDLSSFSTEELSEFTLNIDYLSSACASLLERLICPAVLALRQSAVECCLWTVDNTRKQGSDVQRVVPRNVITNIIERLLSLIIEPENDGTRVRAREALAVVSQTDYYYWKEARRLAREQGVLELIAPLSYPSGGPSRGYHVFQARCMNIGTYKESFTIRQDTLPLKFRIETIRQRETCSNCQEPMRQHAWLQMRFFLSDVLWLKVQPDHPFNPTMHFPVRAGANVQGDELYLCATTHDELTFKTETVEFCAYSKADLENEELYQQKKNVYVIVLRYDPNAFSVDHLLGSTEGSSCRTGPFFWSPFEI